MKSRKLRHDTEVETRDFAIDANPDADASLLLLDGQQLVEAPAMLGEVAIWGIGESTFAIIEIKSIAIDRIAWLFLYTPTHHIQVVVPVLADGLVQVEISCAHDQVRGADDQRRTRVGRRGPDGHGPGLLGRATDTVRHLEQERVGAVDVARPGDLTARRVHHGTRRTRQQRVDEPVPIGIDGVRIVGVGGR